MCSTPRNLFRADAVISSLEIDGNLFRDDGHLFRADGNLFRVEIDGNLFRDDGNLFRADGNLLSADVISSLEIDCTRCFFGFVMSALIKKHHSKHKQ